MTSLPASLSESEFLRTVRELAHVRGWLTAHFHDSRRQVSRGGRVVFIGDAAAAGFPDLVLARAPRLIVAELKSARGQLRPAQRHWLAALEGCDVETYLWRPSDWDSIVEILR